MAIRDMHATTPTIDPRRRLLKAMGGLLLFAWAWQWTGIALGALEPGNGVAFALTLGPVMFSPLVAGILYVRASGRRLRDLPWRLGRPGHALLGLAIPTAMMLVMVALWQALGWGASDLLAFGDGGIALPKGPWVLGRDADASALAAINVAATMVLFGVLNSVATVGEEFGWRGVFQAEFVRGWGLPAGVALLGFTWGIWHLPVNLAGYNYPAFPVLGALVLFPLTLIAHSMILAWLTIAGRSMWPAILFHAGINSLYVGVTASLWRGGRAAEFHAIEIALFSALAGFAYWRLRRATAAARDGARPDGQRAVLARSASAAR